MALRSAVGPHGHGLGCPLDAARRSRARTRADNWSAWSLQQTLNLAAAEPYHSYRLGDVYMRDTPPDLDYHLVRWPSSLASSYVACRTRNQDAATLDALLQRTCTAEHAIGNETVVHLRLGDMLCYDADRPKNGLHAVSRYDAMRRRPPTIAELVSLGRRLEVVVANTTAVRAAGRRGGRRGRNQTARVLEQLLPNPRGEVRILYGDHSGKCLRESRRYAALAAAILNATVDTAGSPDDHLCRMVGAGLFVQGTGGFSRLAAVVRARRGKPTWTDLCSRDGANCRGLAGFPELLPRRGRRKP